jgi:type IV pilus assembly protein PilB
MAEKIGELLVSKNIITPEQLATALKDQQERGGRIGSALNRLGFVTESELLQFLSEQYSVPSIKLSEFTIDPDVLKIIPDEVASKYHVMPLSVKNSNLIVAMSDPSNIFALDDIKFLTGYRVEPLIAAEGAILSAIDTYYKTTTAGLGNLLDEYNVDVEDVNLVEETDDIDLSSLERASEDAPVVKLVNAILTDAVAKGCSDIHIEAYEKTFRVRFRIDGSLYELMRPPISMKNAIVSRLKIMARLDIAERRLPQDGRIKLKMGKGREMDYRVSVLPTLFGEKVVLRLLDKANLQLDMTKLGFDSDQLVEFQHAIHMPYGMVLVTGPTGSGKTTTLYSALSELNKVSENISTAEDPVEFNLEGINQVQMHEEIGLTFANSLRSFLRQDPDIILVGEVRDFETAEIAIKAALTGHLVLSTLHTNDAPSTINRLLNMGVEPFLVSSSLNLVVAQRLARRICNNCREPLDVAREQLESLGSIPESVPDPVSLSKGLGCDACSNTGYKGRIAMYEVMMMQDSLKELVLQGASAMEIKREAVESGMKTLRRSGINKLLAGTTTIEEILRTTVLDDK